MSTRAQRNFLPNNYKIAHDLCFAVHDVPVQFLISGQQSGVFIAEVDLNDSEAESIKSHGDIFEWLDSAGRVKDRAKVLKILAIAYVIGWIGRGFVP